MIKALSNIGTRLDKTEANPLRMHKRKKRMVADAVQIEPISASKFPANREIYRKFC